MDLRALSELFATTYNPDPNIRKAAEAQIKNLGSQEGMISALLQIIAENGVDLSIRQACAVYIKNRVLSSYFEEADNIAKTQIIIQPSDRSALKSAILPLLASSPSRSISSQLANTFKIIASRDFPHQWAELLSLVKKLLTSGDVREVSAGCVATLELVRAFRFRQKNSPMQTIVAEIFPTLANIAATMIAQPISISPTSEQEVIPLLLHLILKAYKTSIVLNLSPHQMSAESIVPWGRLLFQVVNLQIPLDVLPSDEEEREKCEWWKVKKWAFGTLWRLFSRYGNPSQLPSPLQAEYGAFAKHFVSSFAPEIIKMYLQQVDLIVSAKAFLSKKCQYLILQFFTECVKPRSTWQLLKPHAQTLISSFAFPLLCFSEDMKEKFEHDPIEYVRITLDEGEAVHTPLSGAIAFAMALASNRTKTSFLPMIGFINSILASNVAPPQRFGALNMTSALGLFMMQHPTVKDNMEEFVLQHVAPQYNAPEPYLRFIAFEVLGTLTKCGLHWSSPEILNQNFHAVASALNDPELPVRVQATLAFTELIQAHESVRDIVAPQIGKVIEDLLKLSEDTDIDILNSCMETMVECYPTELLPVAVQLTTRLCHTYMRMARETVASDELEVGDADLEVVMTQADDSDEKIYSAMGCAKTIGAVLSSIDTAPEILAEVLEVVVPIIEYTLKNKAIDLFDNMFDLLDSLTFKNQKIAPSLWPIWELVYALYKSDASDFLDELLPALDNYVSYGTDVFKSRSDYRDMIVDIYTSTIASSHLGENDRVNACRLAESILMNLRGSVDNHLERILTTALDLQGHSETKALVLANLEVIINSILYNPAAALQIMENVRPGAARSFFDQWFTAITSDKLPRVHDKKLCIMTLCAMMEMNPLGVPENLKEVWAHLVSGALKLFKDLPKAIRDRKLLEESLEEEDEDGDFLEEGRLLNLNGEEDDDVWDEDSAYLEMLAKESARLRAKEERLDEDEDVSDRSGDEDVEEELAYLSPLENINPYASFKQALNAFQLNNPAAYQVATTSLTVENQTLLMEVMRIAETVPLHA